MAKYYKVIGKVTRYELLESSYYGNPKYHLSITTESGEIIHGKTATDAQIGYECLNSMNENHKWLYHKTPKGNIIFDQMF
jgi:hypothetical protein